MVVVQQQPMVRNTTSVSRRRAFLRFPFVLDVELPPWLHLPTERLIVIRLPRATDGKVDCSYRTTGPHLFVALGTSSPRAAESRTPSNTTVPPDSLWIGG
jgi:hypothetical protein